MDPVSTQHEKRDDIVKAKQLQRDTATSHIANGSWSTHIHSYPRTFGQLSRRREREFGPMQMAERR